MLVVFTWNYRKCCFLCRVLYNKSCMDNMLLEKYASMMQKQASVKAQQEHGMEKQAFGLLTRGAGKLIRGAGRGLMRTGNALPRAGAAIDGAIVNGAKAVGRGAKAVGGAIGSGAKAVGRGALAAGNAAWRGAKAAAPVAAAIGAPGYIAYNEFMRHKDQAPQPDPFRQPELQFTPTYNHIDPVAQWGTTLGDIPTQQPFGPTTGLTSSLYNPAGQFGPYGM